MGKPDPPTPPSPVETAKASTSTNVGTAIANSFLNNVNQNTADGSLRYDQTGSYTWNDPYTGTNVNIPTFTATQSLSPQARAIRDQTDASKFNLAGLANSQSARLSSVLNSNFDPMKSAPGRGDIGVLRDAPSYMSDYGAAGPVQSVYGGHGPIKSYAGNPGAIADTFDAAGQIQGGFGASGQRQENLGASGQLRTGISPYGQVQGQVGLDGQFGDAGQVQTSYQGADDFSYDRQRVEDTLMARMNPQLNRDNDRLRQQLADQGIQYGSAAYESAMSDFGRQSNDARFGAILNAGQEQERMVGMANAAGQFSNAAQQQRYGQSLGEAGFENAAQRQGFEELAARGQFVNQAQQQGYQQELGRGQFANEAQQQEYGQALGRGQFRGAMQQQRYTQQMGAAQFANDAQRQTADEFLARASFANAAQNQEFQQKAARGSFYNQATALENQRRSGIFAGQNELRNQYLNEAYTSRNQPINEISALLSGSQVGQPNFVNVGRNNIPTTDVAGLINTRFNQDMDIYKQEVAQSNALLGGVLGFGAGIMKSDENAKKDIKPLGSVAMPRGQELPIYEYRYKEAGPGTEKRVGPMAQDMEDIAPWMVTKVDGVKHIKWGMGSNR